MHRSVVTAAVPVLTAVLLAGAGAGPSLAARATGASDRVTSPDWHDCHTANTPPQLECATLAMPLDWSRPAGPKIKLALNRLPATDPARRIGPLLLNPGGPGGSGTQTVAWGGMMLGSAELKPLRTHFDLIGFDPREPATALR